MLKKCWKIINMQLLPPSETLLHSQSRKNYKIFVNISLTHFSTCSLCVKEGKKWLLWQCLYYNFGTLKNVISLERSLGTTLCWTELNQMMLHRLVELWIFAEGQVLCYIIFTPSPVSFFPAQRDYFCEEPWKVLLSVKVYNGVYEYSIFVSLKFEHSYRHGIFKDVQIVHFSS